MLDRALVLLGLRRTPDSHRLFTSWHSYPVVLIAAIVIGVLIKRG